MSDQRHPLTPIILLGLTHASFLPTIVRAQTECPNIACGQSIQDEIQIPGDQNCLAFSNTGHHSVSVYLGSEADGTLLLSVTAPDGQVQDCDTFFGSCELDLTISQTGTYVATVDGSGGATGGYTLTFNCLETDQTPISCGDFFVDTLSPAGDEDYYTFENAAPTPVSIYLGSEASGTLVLTITAPDGQFRNCDTFFGSCELEIPAGQVGTYVITVDGAGGALGDYTLSLQCVGHGAQTICPGESHDGELGHPGDEQDYEFDGVAGESVAIFLESQADGVLLLRLTAPDGTEWICDTFFGSCEINESLPLDGSYLVTVDGSGGAAGGYSVSLSCLELCPPCEPGFGISSLWPNRSGNTGPVTITIIGREISPGASVRLVREGSESIAGQVVHVGVAGYSISATFQLRAQTTGTWDITVTNPDGKSQTLMDAFTVEKGGAPNLWIDVIGSEQIRVGFPQTYSIRFGNKGTIDTYDCLLRFRVPTMASISVALPPPQPSSIDWTLIPLDYVDDLERVLPVWLLKVPAGRSATFDVSILITDADIGQAVNIRWELDQAVSLFATTGVPQDVDTSPIFQSIVEAVSESAGTLDAGEFKTPVTSQQNPDVWNDRLREVAEGYMSQSLGHIPDESDAAGGIVGALLGWLFGEMLDGFLSGAELGGAVGNAVGMFGNKVNELEAAAGLLNAAAGALSGGLVGSVDPNAKVGHHGIGQSRYIPADLDLMFVVYFENLSTATAPARDVLVVDRLDVDVLDVANATFEDLTIGTRRLSIDRNGWKAGGTFDLDEDPGLRVQIAVELEPSTGQIQWRLQTIDAATGLPPADPFLGFLPPNTNPPSGQGSVSLRIRARSALATGTTIRNRATITFDTNAPIETDEWINTIDNSKPESRVEAFGAVDTFPVEVRWSGTDQGAGIRDYTIYSSTDDGPFEVWLGNTTETTAMFQGSTDHEYSFYSIARDHVGNVELPPNSPDAEITVRAVPADLIGGICGSGACGAGSTTAMILCLWCVSAQRLHSHRKHKEATPRMRRK